jgi:hypothetical protein
VGFVKVRTNKFIPNFLFIFVLPYIKTARDLEGEMKKLERFIYQVVKV